MKKIKVKAELLFVLCLLILCNGCLSKSDTTYIFKLDKKYVTGKYTGEKTNRKPNGEGKFVCTDEKSNLESYSGNWEDGLPEGKGVLEYRDGTILEGTFKEGELNGEIKKIYSDHSYSTVLYRNGKPYGKESFYDANDKEKKVEYYYNGETLSEIKKNIENVNYGEVLSNPEAFIGTQVKIEGEIKTLYETKDRTYLELKTVEGLSYVIYYEDTLALGFMQTYVAKTIEEKENVTVYGVIEECQNEISYGENEEKTFVCDLEGTKPILKAITVEKKEISKEKIDSDLEEYMYYHVEDDFYGKGIVFNVIIDYEKKKIYYGIETENKEIIYLVTHYAKGKRIYISGNNLSFSAKVKGYYKVKETEDMKYFEKYPLFAIKKVERIES